MRHLRDITAELAQKYLADRAAAGIGQKQLDTDRNALEFVTGKGSLARETAISAPDCRSRAYTPDQIQAVAAHQDPRNALATEIAWRAGLRAHELLSIRRPARRGRPSTASGAPTDSPAGKGSGTL